MKKKSRSDDRGAAVVEFALVVPLLLLILFGIIDIGRMINMQMRLTEGAREGSRLAVVVPGSSTGAVLARVRLVAPGASIPSVGSCLNASPGTQVTVTATQRFEFATPLGAFAAMFGSTGWGGDFDMTAEGVSTCRN